MSIIRPAVMEDREDLRKIGEHLVELYPMRPDREKIEVVLDVVIQGSQHFAMVVEEDGKIQGMLIALTSPNLWAQRSNCAVLVWGSNIPGQGAALLRRFKKWLKGRRGIRVAGFTPDLDTDPRVWDLVQRIGFEQHGGSYLIYN